MSYQEDLQRAIAKALSSGMRERQPDEDGLPLANAIGVILSQLNAGTRPLATEIQRALDASATILEEDGLRCDSVAVRSPAVLAELTKNLTALERGARLATCDDLMQVATATEKVLRQLLSSADMGKTFSRADVAARTHQLKKFAKGAGHYSDEELVRMEAVLSKEFTKWTEKARRGETACPHNCPLTRCTHYLEVEDKLHKVTAALKRSRGAPMAAQRQKA